MTISSTMIKDTIVVYPSPGIGHLISMVELGKLILTHYPSFSITILITTTPFHPISNTAPYLNKISKSTPQINFHHLPTITLPPSSTTPTSTNPGPPPIFEIFNLNNPLIHQALQSISLTSTVRCFILDFFCAVALQVTSQLKIPSYVFFTSGAAALAVFLHFPIITSKIAPQLIKNPKTTLLNFPGVPPMLSADVPSPVLPTDKTHEFFKSIACTLWKVDGIILNSFEYLEKRSIKAIKDGKCLPLDAKTPPLFCVGPLIAEPESSTAGNVSHECVTWLKSQPSRSVVFLCFGSGGVFSIEQLKEIAVGLERSGQRFLWVVRNAPEKQDIKTERRSIGEPEPHPDFDLDALLPDGFLDRTRDRGLVLKNWAPQVDVLSQESVGGFVTHCGWNSVLESIRAGVPMVGWPLYAEQRMNRVLLVEEMKLAIPMKESEDGFVSSEEVEKRVREVIASEELRERVLTVRDEAKAALSEGGPSLLELDELIKSWELSSSGVAGGGSGVMEKSEMRIIKMIVP